MRYRPELVARQTDRIWSMIIGGSFALGLCMALVALLLTGYLDLNWSGERLMDMP